jgi:long-chain fatty acid transport protein
LKSFAVLTTLLGVATAAGPAFADGGYYSGTLGARAAGRGGAFVARADDITAVSFNPAGLAKLDGTIFQFGNRLSYNSYDFTRAPTVDYGQNGNPPPTVTFDRVRNGTPWQALEPLLGVASNLGLSGWGFALAAFAPPGVSKEEYPIGGGQRYMMVSREAVIVDYAASAAWRYRDVFGVGATLEWISMPRLIYSLVIDGTTFRGAANPVSSQFDMLATTNGSDPFTFNAILGAWFRPAPFLEIGLAGQVVPASMVAHSKLSVTALDPSLGDVTLTRNGSLANDVTVTLPLPLMARAGARYRHLAAGREVFDIELDVEYETWSRAKAFTVDSGGLEATAMNVSIPIGKIEIQKQWRDTLGVKLGGDFALVPNRFTVRAGAFYETAVAPAAYANMDFPGGQRVGGSVGASLMLSHWEVALAYQLRLQPTFTVAEADARGYQQVPASSCVAPYTDATSCNPAYRGQPSPAVNAGTYTASSHLVSLAFIYRYGR